MNVWPSGIGASLQPMIQQFDSAHILQGKETNLILMIVGVILLLFSVTAYRVAQKDFNENPWDFTPFPEEVMQIHIIQQLSSFVMDITYFVILFLSVSLIVKGLASIV